MSTTELAEQFRNELIELRRALHQAPELGLELPNTQALVLAALRDLDLEITLGGQLSSVTAVLRGAGDGPAVLLRGDMDALPLTERLDLPYASRHQGRMHACGHDLHTAILVGAAKVLHAQRDQLAGDVVFMFQPGEEGYAGARLMIEEGVLDAAGQRVVAAYGLHVQSTETPRGHWRSKAGPLMAAVGQLEIRVLGAGTHGSLPHRGQDPVPVAAEIVLGLQTMVTRQFDVFDPVVVSVGRLVAGTTSNIIPAEASLDATVRAFSAATMEKVERAARQLAEHVAAAHGLTAEVTFTPGYPVVNNDAEEFALARDAVVDLFGAERFHEYAHPTMPAEDMAYVLAEVPGAFLHLGAAATDDWDNAPANHSPYAAFDDSVVPEGAALLAELARRRLARG
ncbi:M20 family metallopeptidase [Kribbella sp. NPDC051770]|uniref:M20 metallopeptidase family protein n=1 Tax=Kribbella sp. NPDC051770 TaxID=3155413 RepID=UPI00342CE1ED